jgi:hypothetical protein
MHKSNQANLVMTADSLCSLSPNSALIQAGGVQVKSLS